MIHQIADLARVKFSPVDPDTVDVLTLDRWAELWNVLVVARQMCRFGKKATTSKMRLLIGDGASPNEVLQPFDDGIATLENALTFMQAARARVVVGMAAACA